MTTLPLAGIKIIDFTGVQAGPACTQLLAWYGADVLKVERVGVGDVTRNQLRDIPDADALYFTMLNSNKRSLTLNTKTPAGLAIMEKLIRDADVLVENFGPGAMDRMGLSWDHIHELNPRLIYGSVKGFDEQSRFADLKVYEMSHRRPAALPPRPASGTVRRPSAQLHWGTRTPACTWPSACSPHCWAVRRQVSARRSPCPCRTPFST